MGRQRELVFRTWGGKRKGAGRKRKGDRRRVPHLRRCEFRADQPLHVTLRVLDEVGRLRIKGVLGAVAEALRVVGQREDLRIVHTSIQNNHLHLYCEATSRHGRARGMQAFKTSVGKRINTVLGRSGRVFADRYHYEVVTSPKQARAVLCYVMNNWRKHHADRGCRDRVDPYATGMWFRGWKERDIPTTLVIPPGVIVLPHREPRTWLLREGIKKCPPISLFEVPGPRS
jgi:REP element-mobilizing transposase RayT